jgi:hypothetical protein
MRNIKKIVLIILICISFILILFWLKKHRENDVSISFYYWKSEFKLTDKEKSKIQDCSSDRLYLHLFDVAIETGKNEATPKAKIKFVDQFPEQVSLVPVIYITNKTFEQANTSSNKDLAKKIIQLSHKLTRTLNNKWVEFQIDCDWTVSTKENYFEFLRLLKIELGPDIPLSATLRLHQIKYPEKTGIPPIDRGILMFYNMGDLRDFSQINTIYDEQTASTYLDKLSDFPIKMDYALPAFSWGLHYRLKTIQSILSDIQLAEIQTSNAFNTKDNVSICLKDIFCSGQYFQKGDIVKLERVSSELCAKASKQLAKHINSSNFQVVFYHLGSEVMHTYETKQLKDIGTIFN